MKGRGIGTARGRATIMRGESSAPGNHALTCHVSSKWFVNSFLLLQ